MERDNELQLSEDPINDDFAEQIELEKEQLDRELTDEEMNFLIRR